MEKKIFSVGWDFPGDDHKVEEIDIRDHRSLADADIVVFSPTIDLARYYCSENKTYMGQTSLGQDASARLHRDVLYWREELRNFIESGKTAFIILDKPTEGYCATGQKDYSGKGRNTRVTQFVEPFHSYSILPLNLSPRISFGSGISYIEKNDNLRFLYEFLNEMFSYQVVLDAEKFNGTAAFRQSKGTGILGGTIRSKNGGRAVLLPYFELEREDFSENHPEYGKIWSKKALAFSKALVSQIVRAEKALREATEESVAPEWTGEAEFCMAAENECRESLASIENEIHSLGQKRNETLARLKSVKTPSKLLFSKGIELEIAVRDALTQLGFEVEHFRENGSEFDAVFRSAEGTFLGEVEGRDDSAIDVKKISQLMRNGAEYLDIKGESPNGVLFGNGFRLKKPAERPEQFTQKCISVAGTSRISLVATSDLFQVIRKIKDHGADREFLKNCREVILNSKGKIVTFPLTNSTEFHLK